MYSFLTEYFSSVALVLHAMYSFLTEYFSSVALVLHASRCRAAQVG
jgi:hypothetical protein